MEVKSLRETRANLLEFAKKQAAVVDERDGELHKWKKRTATFEQNLDAAQSKLHI